jgi:hypothetical protein
MIATIARSRLAAHAARAGRGLAFAGLMSVSNLADICSITPAHSLRARLRQPAGTADRLAR